MIFKLETRVLRLTGGDLNLTLSNVEDENGAYQGYLTDLIGWYGGVGVNLDSQQRVLGHGTFPGRSTRSAREITVKGTMVFNSEADRLVADRFLSGVLWDGKEGTLEVTTGGLTQFATVKLSSEISHEYLGTHSLRVQIPLTASDPFIYAAPRLYQIFPAGAGQGLVFPLFSTKMAGSPNPATVRGLPEVSGTGVVEDSAVNSTPDGGKVAKITATTASLFFGSWGGATIPATLRNQMCRLRIWVFSPTGESVTLRVRHNNTDSAQVTNQLITATAKPGVWTPTDLWIRPTPTTSSVTLTAADLTSTTDNPIWVGGALATGGNLSPVLDWGAGAPVGGAFANSGNVDAHPVYTVHGSWSAGFRITTGSKVIEYPAPVVAGHPVVVNHRTGSVSVAGVDQTYRLTRRDWVAVPPGEAIQPRIEPLAPSTGWCDITISDTYI